MVQQQGQLEPGASGAEPRTKKILGNYTLTVCASALHAPLGPMVIYGLESSYSSSDSFPVSRRAAANCSYLVGLKPP